MKKLSKTILTSVVTLLLAVGLVPADALAEEPEPVVTLVSTLDGVTGLAAGASVFDINDPGQVVFASRDASLPGANGELQLYFWDVNTGIALITNTGTSEVPVGASGGYARYAYLSATGAVTFEATYADLPDANDSSQVYYWSSSSGLLCIGLKGSSGWSHSPSINATGSVVFLYTDQGDQPASSFLPTYAYLWTETDGLTLVTDAKTANDPVPGSVSSLSTAQLNDDGSVVFESYDERFPGGNGETQVYLWTPSDGVTLITNVGTLDHPVGSEGGNYHPTSSDAEHVVFESVASDLPGGNGDRQVYLWTAADGLTLITNIGTSDTPVGVSGDVDSDHGNPYSDPVVSKAGSVVFTSRQVGLPGGNGSAQIYVWEPARGLELITNVGTSGVPVGTTSNPYGEGNDYSGPGFGFEGARLHAINGAGAIVFCSDGVDLPGGTGVPQLYRWTRETGLTLITNDGTTDAPVGDVNGWWRHSPIINGQGVIAFDSSASVLPGANGNTQIYLWSPTSLTPSPSATPTVPTTPKDDATGSLDMTTIILIAIAAVGSAVAISCAVVLIARSRRKNTAQLSEP